MAEAVTQLQLGFRGGRDPYGAPWRALKVRRGKPLLDTGRQRGSFSAQPTSNGFRIGTNVVYAAAHQFGTKRLPRRSMLPTSDGGLGPIWRPAFEKAAKTAFKKLWR